MVYLGEETITRAEYAATPMHKIYQQRGIPNEKDGYVIQWELDAERNYLIKWMKDDKA